MLSRASDHLIRTRQELSLVPPRPRWGNGSFQSGAHFCPLGRKRGPCSGRSQRADTLSPELTVGCGCSLVPVTTALMVQQFSVSPALCVTGLKGRLSDRAAWGSRPCEAMRVVSPLHGLWLGWISSSSPFPRRQPLSQARLLNSRSFPADGLTAFPAAKWKFMFAKERKHEGPKGCFSLILVLCFPWQLPEAATQACVRWWWGAGRQAPLCLGNPNLQEWLPWLGGGHPSFPCWEKAFHPCLSLFLVGGGGSRWWVQCWPSDD